MSNGTAYQVTIQINPDFVGGVDEAELQAAVMATLRQQGAPPNTAVTLVIAGDEEIHRLNRQFRQVDAPTDVLSFSQDPDRTSPATVPAGDIVISVETLRRNAHKHRIPEEEELKRLLIHGILHLEGMDHEDEQSEMIRLQERVLTDLKKERIF